METKPPRSVEDHSKLDRLHNVTGIEPVNWFECNLKIKRFVKLPISDGMEPVS